MAVERRVPLYEAKMIHHFDHRWATFPPKATPAMMLPPTVTLDEKRDPAFEPHPAIGCRRTR